MWYTAAAEEEGAVAPAAYGWRGHATANADADHEPALQPGPAYYEQIGDFVDRLMVQLRAYYLENEDSLDSALDGWHGRRLVVSTHYSGLGSAEWSIKYIQKALADRGCDLQVVFFSACDSERKCKKALAAHKQPAKHLFIDLLDRVDPGANPIASNSLPDLMPLSTTTSAHPPAHQPTSHP